jgi:hypothetical protein
MDSGGRDLLATEAHTQEVCECLNLGHGFSTAVSLVSQELLGAQTDQVGNGLDLEIGQDVKGTNRQPEIIHMQQRYRARSRNHLRPLLFLVTLRELYLFSADPVLHDMFDDGSEGFNFLEGYEDIRRTWMQGVDSAGMPST